MANRGMKKGSPQSLKREQSRSRLVFNFDAASEKYVKKHELDLDTYVEESDALEQSLGVSPNNRGTRLKRPPKFTLKEIKAEKEQMLKSFRKIDTLVGSKDPNTTKIHQEGELQENFSEYIYKQNLKSQEKTSLHLSAAILLFSLVSFLTYDERWSGFFVNILAACLFAGLSIKYQMEIKRNEQAQKFDMFDSSSELRIEVAQKRAESFSFDRLNMISNYCVLLGGCLIATATLFVQTNLAGMRWNRAAIVLSLYLVFTSIKLVFETSTVKIITGSLLTFYNAIFIIIQVVSSQESAWFDLFFSNLLLIFAITTCVVVKERWTAKSSSGFVYKNLLYSERFRTQHIIDSLLPADIYREMLLREGKCSIREGDATIGYVKISVLDQDDTPCSNTVELVSTLHSVVCQLDKVIAIYNNRGLVKIEHVGNIYLICGGLLSSNKGERPTNHARAVIDCCLGMQHVCPQIKMSQKHKVVLTIGINSGQVVGGVIGAERKFFRVFGDTVNTASRVCTTGVKGIIQVSQTTFEEANGNAFYRHSNRGQVYMKGKGIWFTSAVMGRESNA